jgi:hypothetical protein
MKLKYTSWLFLFIALAVTGIFTSCEQNEDLPNGGKPMVSYIRVTSPASSDSLLAKAGQGQMLAIIGQNLQDAREIWFNNRPAALTPTFITNTSIITRVPTEIPTQINNKMKIIFANGDSLLHDFTVDISEPVISGMASEYVNEGEIATINGNYFYAPLTVTFTGGVKGNIVKVEDGVLQVAVPAGAQPGPITISTNFGETESDFWFRDNRNLIASFDGTTAGLWTGPDFIKASDPLIPTINGKFMRVNKTMSAYPYAEIYVGPVNSDVALETKNIPAKAFTNPKDYVLKFEINTLASLTGAELRMYMGTGDMGADRNNIYYNWKPNIDTKGEWQTVSIPFEDFYLANKSFPYSAAGYGVSFYFHGPLPVKGDFALDNMRVVPNTL